MIEEYLDILNKKGEKTGEAKSYDEVHREGFIHRTAHVWFVNSKKQILLQKRSSNNRAYPNYWDISAAGHISAGQTSLQGAQMETMEELGLSLSDEVFIFLCTLEENIILNQGTYVNNEFQDVYVVRMDVELSKMHSDNEVSELKWVDFEAFKLMSQDEKFKLVPHAEEYKQLIRYIENI
ncbi:MAG: NUDIX hydrolase [Minisyncoccota bacterium]